MKKTLNKLEDFQDSSILMKDKNLVILTFSCGQVMTFKLRELMMESS